MDTREKILSAASSVIMAQGLTGCSVESIAREAGCAKGLVNYHFRSKTALLDEVSKHLRDLRLGRRLEALRATGTDALDRFWEAMEAEVSSGEARAWFSLAADPETAAAAGFGRSEYARIGESASRALGLDQALPGLGLLCSALDGVQLARLGGQSAADVREAYERLWLAFMVGADR